MREEKKEPGTHFVQAQFPRISGNLEISEKSPFVYRNYPCVSSFQLRKCYGS